MSGVATATACGFVTQFVEFQRFQVVVILWLAFAALADVIIAVSLVSHLVRIYIFSRRRGRLMARVMVGSAGNGLVSGRRTT